MYKTIFLELTYNFISFIIVLSIIRNPLGFSNFCSTEISTSLPHQRNDTVTDRSLLISLLIHVIFIIENFENCKKNWKNFGTSLIESNIFHRESSTFEKWDDPSSKASKKRREKFNPRNWRASFGLIVGEAKEWDTRYNGYRSWHDEISPRWMKLVCAKCADYKLGGRGRVYFGGWRCTKQ